MEGNYLTSGDLAMWDTARTSRAGNFYGEGYGCGYGHRRDGMAATGIGLASAALLGVLAVGWGVNQASKARSRAAENAAAGNTKAIEIVTSVLAQDRQCRENWQNMHAPTITQYTDVRTGAGAFAGAGATSAAEAVALNAILGNNGRSGQVCPQPVALYQPAMPCRCNTCGD